MNGDRITGTRVGRSRRSFTIRTPYGRLTVPRAEVARILHDDGSEEIVSAPVAPMAPVPPPPPPRTALTVVISGHTFWYAWDARRQAGADPRLRLVISLDGSPVAVFTDTKVDPEGIRGARVNAFSFAPADVVVEVQADHKVAAPEVRPGRIGLSLDLALPAGPRRLRLAYQVNMGSPDAPLWEDVAAGEADAELRPETTLALRAVQSRGRMEFAQRRMQGAQTFQIDLGPA
jgi:hypothetical protein